MNKKGATGMGVFIVLGVVAILGILGFVAVKLGTLGTAVPGTPGTEPQTNFCANNPDVDMEITWINQLNDTLGTVCQTYAIIDKTSGIVTTDTATGCGANSNSFDDTNSLVCGHAYDIVSTSTSGGFNSGFSVSLSSAETMSDPVRVDAKSYEYSPLQMRFKDLNDDAYLATNRSDATEFYEWQQTGFNSSVETVGQGQSFGFQLDMRTNSADRQCGTGAFAAIDYKDGSNTDDWVEPTTTASGQTITEGAGIAANDRQALADFDAFYLLPYTIGETTKELRFDMQTGSQNPDFDPTVRVCCLGTRQSDDNKNVILGQAAPVAFRDDSARTVLQMNATGCPELRVDIT